MSIYINNYVLQYQTEKRLPTKNQLYSCGHIQPQVEWPASNHLDQLPCSFPRLFRPLCHLPEELMVHLHTANNERQKHTHLNRLNPKQHQKYRTVDDIVLLFVLCCIVNLSCPANYVTRIRFVPKSPDHFQNITTLEKLAKTTVCF